MIVPHWLAMTTKYVLWGVLLYIVYCGLLFFLQRQIIFPRHMAGGLTAMAKPAANTETWWLETSAGRVECWFLPGKGGPEGQPMPAVVCAHGNAETIDGCLWEAELFTRLGIAALLVEYPGYGRSAGKPSEASITLAFTAAYDRLATRPDIDTGRIFFYGRSLGGGAVCALARKRPAAALVLMSTFTSIRSFAKRHFAPEFLVRDPFDNLSLVRNFDNPILILHGKRDSTIPFNHSKRLAQAAPHAETIAYDCGHNDCPPDWAVFSADVQAFLIRCRIIGQRSQGITPRRDCVTGHFEVRRVRLRARSLAATTPCKRSTLHKARV